MLVADPRRVNAYVLARRQLSQVTYLVASNHECGVLLRGSMKEMWSAQTAQELHILPIPNSLRSQINIYRLSVPLIHSRVSSAPIMYEEA